MGIISILESCGKNCFKRDISGKQKMPKTYFLVNSPDPTPHSFLEYEFFSKYGVYVSSFKAIQSNSVLNKRKLLMLTLCLASGYRNGVPVKCLTTGFLWSERVICHFTDEFCSMILPPRPLLSN